MQVIISHYRRISATDFAVFIISDQQSAFLAGRNQMEIMDWIAVWGTIPVYSGLSETQANLYKGKVEDKISVDEKRPGA